MMFPHSKVPTTPISSFSSLLFTMFSKSILSVFYFFAAAALVANASAIENEKRQGE